jgi:hypothetical protein
VKREEFFLIADFIEHWGEELEEMIKNKRYKKCTNIKEPFPSTFFSQNPGPVIGGLRS